MGLIDDYFYNVSSNPIA